MCVCGVFTLCSGGLFADQTDARRPTRAPLSRTELHLRYSNTAVSFGSIRDAFKLAQLLIFQEFVESFINGIIVESLLSKI